MNRFKNTKTKLISYTLIFSFIISSSPSYAMMKNYTDEVWGYDNVTHRATYSCPQSICGNCEKDPWYSSMGYAVAGAFTGLILEKISYATLKGCINFSKVEDLFEKAGKGTWKGMKWCGEGIWWGVKGTGKGVWWCIAEPAKGIGWCCNEAWKWGGEKWNNWRAQGGVHG